MPSSKARDSPSVERRDRLTLAKLASYDDVATDALVDRAYFWTKTRKNRTKYNPIRGIVEDDIARIILHDVIVAKDSVKAEQKLLATSGLKKYLAKLSNDREKEWFRRHLRKYIQMYLPDSPFEVMTTNRYTITEHEAAICARKFIKQGEEIKYLGGTLVPVTREEEQDLDLKRKDFSIVMSSRRKTPSFFLGPARFANHDCNANGRLVTRGSEGMLVMATRDIYTGEEITVSYGDDYFGIDNCECLCLTCERAVRNGWAPRVDSGDSSPASTPALPDDALSLDSHLSPRKRKQGADPDSDSSPSSTPRKRTKFMPQSSKLRSEVSLTEITTSVESTSDQPPQDVVLPDSTEEPPAPLPPVEVAAGSTTVMKIVTEHQINVETTGLPPPPAVTGCESPSSSLEANDSQHSSTSTAATSVCEVKIKVEETIEVSPREPNDPTPTPTAMIEPGPELPEKERLRRGSDNDALSDLSESLELDEKLGTVVERTKGSRGSRTRHAVVPSVEAGSRRTRVPGDYTKTPKLLAQAYDRWVDCHTCNAWFVQHNSYLTRRECPRCERHSMLYGFRWPKTDREGSSDDEERVMDHRTVHRFLYPDEEARISRKDRGVSFGVTPTPELAYDDPLVRLDYGAFQGKYDATYNLSYFRKIPYASPPTGTNRFRAPQPPQRVSNGIYNTDQDFDMCPQRTVNGSEDCLYLGLFSRPWDITSAARRPVLVVFYGGAFIQGSASFTIPPSSYPVLNVSNLNDYVVIYPNYRVNAFGFLPGKAIKDSATADLNPGLLDQQFVLKWVQSHIHHVGGDPRNVTIWGQSAGGGSVVAQVLANGRHGNPKLFSKALASSPFWPKTYRYDDPQAETIYSQLVNLTGCASARDSLSCLKSVDVQSIRDASLAISASNQWSTSSYTWAPVIDDSFLVDTLSHATAHSLPTSSIFSTYNTHEGENFLPPSLTQTNPPANSSSFSAWLTAFLPSLSPRDLHALESKYYPPTGSTETLNPYNSTLVRAGLVYRDIVLACPAYWLARAAGNNGYLAEYTIAPAKHASDTIFWNRINPVQQSNPLVYTGYAGSFASFIQTGDPNAHKLTGPEVPGVPRLGGRGPGAKAEAEFVVKESGFENVALKGLRERCGFWRTVGDRVPV
ncbi:alpha/beta-hydrolase [Aspergillus steynii IBT 23096]|uniref:Histone-lysine N-methyltransferase SET9 n=1 Tax=Aspergillus steynii IBT 23096 TaxID=1392250 RepID=A0A2I2G2M2_9EURO|nr:alpha/beta-hydrolase [Aspergillus steynii IBT 23096]PLB47116.1 alpha/beta-hydrolase [Aspergillus steynii IBT 23096]